jgi:hypothetical protein
MRLLSKVDQGKNWLMRSTWVLISYQMKSKDRFCFEEGTCTKMWLWIHVLYYYFVWMRWQISCSLDCLATKLVFSCGLQRYYHVLTCYGPVECQNWQHFNHLPKHGVSTMRRANCGNVQAVAWDSFVVGILLFCLGMVTNKL